MPHQPIDFSKLTVLYVYGTLRPGIKEHEVNIPGLMYDLGYYPGVLVTEHLTPRNRLVRCEKVFVTDEELAQIDGYEGYHEKAPGSSLFRRVKFRDGFIYEYNQPIGSRLPIEGSPQDWLVHRGLDSCGSAAYMVNPRRQGQIASMGLPTCPTAKGLIGIGHNGGPDIRTWEKPGALSSSSTTTEAVSEPPEEVGVAVNG